MGIVVGEDGDDDALGCDRWMDGRAVRTFGKGRSGNGRGYEWTSGGIFEIPSSSCRYLSSSGREDVTCVTSINTSTRHDVHPAPFLFRWMRGAKSRTEASIESFICSGLIRLLGSIPESIASSQTTTVSALTARFRTGGDKAMQDLQKASTGVAIEIMYVILSFLGM